MDAHTDAGLARRNRDTERERQLGTGRRTGRKGQCELGQYNRSGIEPRNIFDFDLCDGPRRCCCREPDPARQGAVDAGRRARGHGWLYALSMAYRAWKETGPPVKFLAVMNHLTRFAA